ncbi:MAG: SMC-Scp complex subunit ScpB [Actinomycetota bacterium]
MTEHRVLLAALEAILFVSDEPIASIVLGQALGLERAEVDDLCEELARDYEIRGAGIGLRNVAGGWRLATRSEVAPIVEEYVRSSRHARLTKAALETLAIVAYKQPVTRHQVSAIRGVNSDGVLRALTDRGLLAEVGREDSPGRPVLIGTTPEFLERLGLASLSDLPSLAPLLGEAALGDDEPGPTTAADADPASDVVDTVDGGASASAGDDGDG